MNFTSDCISCLVTRQFKFARAHSEDERVIRAYLEDVLKTILDSPKNVAGAYLSAQFSKLQKKYFDLDDPYSAIKREANDLMLCLLPQLRKSVAEASDPLAAAIQLACTGNFLDFAVLDAEEIRQRLDEAIEKAPETPLDEATYARFRDDLSNAKTLLMIADNAGEIVTDLVLMEQLKKEYPGLRLVYGVRGDNAQNDATREDAAYTGMDRLAEIIDNGTNIPGTELAYCPEEFLKEFWGADVVISKGQANFECLLGCGANVYYLFLCKCDLLRRVLKVPMFTRMFVNDRSVEI